MRLKDLIQEVAQRTHGTQGDPLTEEEVTPIVQETVRILEDRNAAKLVEEDDE